MAGAYWFYYTGCTYSLKQRNDWSQEALSLAAALDRSYVGTVERMEVNISMDNAEKLARAFGVELVDLLSAEVGGGFR